MREHFLRLEIDMQHWNRLPRFLLGVSLLIGLCAGMFAPRLQKVEAQPVAACPGGIITQWTFTGNVTTTSTGTGLFANGSGITLTFAVGNPDEAVQFTGWTTSLTTLDPNDYVEFSVDTTSISDIAISFDYRSTATGPSFLDIQYSTDGTVFTSFTTISLIRDSSFYSSSYNLSSIVGINNNSNTKFRLYGYGAGGGNLSLDNVTISEVCPPSMTLVINEVAWAGTNANEGHEWIELYNPGSSPINLSDGWRLASNDGTPNIDFSSVSCITPDCTIPAGGYFLLERDLDGVISDISADLIYAGALANSGEILTLYSPENDVIDTANGNGGSWPAGSLLARSSMERIGLLPDSDSSWFTNNGVMQNGLDYNEDPIWGTPKGGNSHTPTPSPTNTPTLTPTITTTPSGVRSVIINEIAWAGTTSGLVDDEWIELYNPGNTSIDISGWRIRAADGTPNIPLNGTIPALGYFLLERDDDNTVRDVAADQIYTDNALSNFGERLTLEDSSGREIDTANRNGGGWPAGSASTFGTMERITGTADSDSAWHTNIGVKRNGLNANGGNILGTPKNSNSIGPTPTPSPIRTATPTATPIYVIDPRAIINEILARPGFDWNQDGIVDVYDEYIEIKNLSPIDIRLSGWKLDKVGGGIFSLPNVTLKPGEHIVFYSKQTNLLLSDGGETIRLYNPQGKIYDAYTYFFAREADRSFCRLPDGNVFGNWFEDCIPTPNLTNTREGRVPAMPLGGYESPVCELPDTIPADVLFAECHGYGADIWNAYYWDQHGWQGRKFIQENMSKWESFIE